MADEKHDDFDAAIMALCDFAEQPHPGRAGEVIGALERYFRSSTPAEEKVKAWTPIVRAAIQWLRDERDIADHGGHELGTWEQPLADAVDALDPKHRPGG